MNDILCQSCHGKSQNKQKDEPGRPRQNSKKKKTLKASQTNAEVKRKK
jgi:ribosome-binding protein aMBF1 (putative translation factor)